MQPMKQGRFDAQKKNNVYLQYVVRHGLTSLENLTFFLEVLLLEEA